MRKILLPIVFSAICTNVSAQQDISVQQQQVQQVVIKMFEALSERDSSALKTYCSPQIRLFEYGQVWTLDTLISKAITQNQSAGFKRSNRFEFIHTSTGHQMAWVTYRLHSEITREGKQTSIQWLETAILSKENEQWKISHLHSTLISRN